MDFSRLKKTQKHVVKLLENSYKKNRLVHAYLFEGARGTLKMEASYYLASLLMCEEFPPCNECINCRRIKKENHPRIYVINPIQDTIKKEQIDALEHEFSRKGLEEGKRVFIINDIDKATLSASNSLLKFLEEMNDDCYGILITESILRVIPTIKSRAQIVSFSNVSKEELIKEYLEKGLDIEIARILSVINNDIDTGLKLIEDGKILDIIELVKKCNESIVLKTTPFLTFYENSKVLFDGVDKNLHQLFLDLLITVTNDRIYRVLGHDEEIVFLESITKLDEYLDNDCEAIIKQVEKMIECKTRLKYNVNLELMYMKMFIDIMR